MNISFDNKVYLEQSIEMARLKALASAGNNVSLNIGDNNGFADNDYVIVGTPMFPKTEIAQINASVSAGSSVQVASLTFDHEPNEPIYRITHDKVRLYSAATANGAKTLVEMKAIDVDQRWTHFEISDNATGYYFFALYSTEEDEISAYSPAFLITDNSNKTRSKIKRFIEIFYKDELDDETLQALIESVVEEIFSVRSWRFREATATFTTTANVTTYDIVDDVGITDFSKLISARTNDQILNVITGDSDDILSLNPLVLVPHTIYEWAGNFHLRVPGAYAITIKYLKSTESLLTSTSKTSMHLASAIGFGVLSLLFESKDEKLADRFDSRYKRAVKAMTKLDNKSIAIHSLPEANPSIYSRESTPNIT